MNVDMNMRAAEALKRFPYTSRELALILGISVGYADNLRSYYNNLGCPIAMRNKANEASRMSKAKSRARMKAPV